MTRVVPVVVLAIATVAPAADVPRPSAEWDSGYFSTASPGDTIFYTDAQGNPVREVEVTRVAGFDRKVTVLRTEYSGRQGVGNKTYTETFSFNGPNPDAPAGVEVRSKETTLRTQSGLDIPCTLRETVSTAGPNKGQVVERVWYSPAVPFDGIARREIDGTTVEVNRYTYQKYRR